MFKTNIFLKSSIEDKSYLFTIFFKIYIGAFWSSIFNDDNLTKTYGINYKVSLQQ